MLHDTVKQVTYKNSLKKGVFIIYSCHNKKSLKNQHIKLINYDVS